MADVGPTGFEAVEGDIVIRVDRPWVPTLWGLQQMGARTVAAAEHN